MKILEAKQLFQWLDQQTPAESLLPIEIRIAKLATLVVPNLLGRGYIRRSSWVGKFSLLLNSKNWERKRVTQLQKLFKEAATTLSKSHEASQGLSLSIRLGIHQLVKTEAAQVRPVPSMPELSSLLEKAKEMEAELKKPAEFLKHSFLRDSVSIPPGVQTSFDAFKNLFQLPSLDCQQSLTQLYDFLKKHAGIAHQKIDDQWSLLTKAKNLHQELKKVLLPKTPLAQVDFDRIIADESKKLVRAVQSNQRLMFCGSHGKKEDHSWMKSLSSFIPEEALKHCPPAVAQFIKNNDLSDPKKILNERLLNPLGQKLDEVLVQAGDKVASTQLKALLGDEQRKFSGNWQQYVPGFITSHLDSWLQQGLLGNVAEFVPDGDLRDLLLWGTEKGSECQDPQKRAEWVEKIKGLINKQVDDLALAPSQNMLKHLEEGLSSFMKQIQKVVPSSILDLLGLEKFFSHSPIWVEFEKQSDGLFTVLVYASGAAIGHHATNEHGQKQWPMRLKDISPERLNQNFFHRLLYHTYAPQANIPMNSTARDFYEGLIGSLQGTEDTSHPEDWKAYTGFPISEFHLAQGLLSAPAVGEGRAYFEMQRESLMEYCRPFLKGEGGQLVIDNSEVAEFLTNAVNEMTETAKMLYSTSAIDEQILKRWMATHEEIFGAVANLRKKQATDVASEKGASPSSLNIPTFILDPLKEVVQNNGIDKSHIDAAKDILCWALGDEVEPLIDALSKSFDVPEKAAPSPAVDKGLVESAKEMLQRTYGSEVKSVIDVISRPFKAFEKAEVSVPDPNSKEVSPVSSLLSLKPSKQPKKGWLRTILFNAYLQTAITAFKTAIYLSILYQRSYSILAASTTPLVSWGIQRAMPRQLQDWYFHIRNQLFQSIQETTFNLIASTLISKQDLARLQVFAKTWKEPAKHWSQVILGTKALSYELEAPLPASSSFKASVGIQTDRGTIIPNPKQTHYKWLRMAEKRLEDVPYCKPQETIPANQILTTLKEWQKEAATLRDVDLRTSDKSVYLCHQISRLEIPKLDSVGFWDTVANPEECLEVLSDLGVALFNARRTNIETLCVENYDELMIASYTLLAIMDKLARRNPEVGLGNHRINAYPLLYWVASEASCVENPELYNRLVAVCQYLTPDVDLKDLLASEDRLYPDFKGIDHVLERLQDLEKSALFSYNYNSGKQANHYLDGNTVFWTDTVWDRKNAEIQYLRQKLKNPEVQHKLDLLLKDIPSKKPKEFSQLQKEAILFEESLNFNVSKEESLLPHAYKLLRLQCLLGNEMIRQPRYSGDFKKLKKTEHTYDQFSSYRRLEQIAKAIRGAFGTWRITVPGCLMHAFTRQAVFVNDFLNLKFSALSLLTESKRGQSSLIEQKLPQFQSILSEDPDRLVRAIAYFKENKKELEDTGKLIFLEYLFFSKGILDRQLKDSPRSAEAIGEMFTETLKHFAEHSQWDEYAQLAGLGIRVHRYCKKIAPNYCQSFPDFRSKLMEVLPATHPLRATFIAMTYGSPETLPPTEKEEGIKWFCSALFHEGTREKKQITASEKLTEEEQKKVADMNALDAKRSLLLNRQMWEWSSLIKQQLQDPEKRTALIESILKNLGIHLEEKGADWKLRYSDLPGIYTCGSFEIDFNNGIVKTGSLSDQSAVEKIKKAIAPFYPDVNQLQIDQAGNFISPDKKFTVTLYPQMDRLELVFRKEIQGVWCKHNTNYVFDKEFEALAGFSHQNGDDLWIEETDRLEKDIFIYRKGTQVAHVRIKESSENEKKGLYRLLSVENEGQMIDPHQRAELGMLLSPLNRFCPSQKTTCWTSSNGSKLEKICFQPYGLSFEIRSVNRELQAVNSTLNATIAKKQNHPALKSMASYLLLSDNKVIIPNGDWAANAALRAASGFGIVAQLANDEIKINIGQEFARGNKYFVYQLENDGLLTSEDPHALSYLLSLYLVQGENEKAFKICELLEQQCKQKAMPKNLEEMLIPLGAAGFALPEAKWVRCRLIAALEENRLIHQKDQTSSKEDVPPKSGSSADHSSMIPQQHELLAKGFLAGLTLMDLTEMLQEQDPRKRLSESQQWFLFSAFLNLFRTMINMKNDENSLMAQGLNLLDVEPLVARFLPGPLAYLYKQLKMKFDKPDSLVEKSLDAVLEVNNSNSLIPPLPTVSSLASSLPSSVRSISLPSFLTSQESIFRSLLSYGHQAIKHQQLDTTFNLNQIAPLLKEKIKNPPLELSQLDASTLVSHFLSYYAIAKGGEGFAKQKELLQLLLVLKGGWEGTSEWMVNCLIAVCKHSTLFPSVKKAEEYIKACHEEQKLRKLRDEIRQLDLAEQSEIKETDRLRQLKHDLLAQGKDEEAKKALLEQELHFNRANSHILLAGEKRKELQNLILKPNYRIDTRTEKIMILNEDLNFSLEDFFKTIHSRTLKAETLDITLLAARKNVVEPYFKRRVLQKLPGPHWLPGLTWCPGVHTLKQGLDLGTKALSAYVLHQDPVALPEKRIQTRDFQPGEGPFAQLDQEDKEFDKMFDELFTTAFEKKPDIAADQADDHVKPFEIDPADSASQQEKTRDINKDIDDFYHREDRVPQIVEFKGQDSLFQTYVLATARHEVLKKQIEADQKVLLEAVNKNGKDRSPVTLDDLKEFFLSGDTSVLIYARMEPQSFAALDAALARNQMRQTRLHQMERVLLQLRALMPLDSNRDKLAHKEKLEKLSEELLARRAYSFKEEKTFLYKDAQSRRFLRRLLNFECSTTTMLWKKQVSCLKKVLIDNEGGNSVYQLLMSLGKTFFAIPLTNAFEADGNQLIINIWPPALAGANVKQITKQGKLFRQIANALTFNRDHPLDEASLHAIYVLLQRAKEQRETLNMTRTDAQALSLMLIEKLKEVQRASKEMSLLEKATLNKVVNQLSKILLAIKVKMKGKAIGDEAHDEFADTDELIYPLGKLSTIRESYFEMIEQCMLVFASDKNLIEILRHHPDKQISESEFKEKTAPLIAEKLANHHQFQFNPIQKQEFKEFVLGNLKVRPDWIAKSKFYSEIAMVKGMLTILMPHTIGKKEGLHYGQSKQNSDDEFAIPFEGNTSPKEGSTIRNPYETVTKTCFMFLKKGLTETQIDRLVSFLEKKANDESVELNLPLEQTEGYLTFKRIFPQAVSEDGVFKFSSQNRTLVSNAFKYNAEAILLYIRLYCYKKIKYPKTNLRSNGQNFASMFYSQIHDTGTPYNDKVYPSYLKLILDPGTTGEALDILSKKCPADGIRLLKSKKPKEVLDEALETYFSTKAGFMSLIDGGAQLTGMENREVVARMRAFIKVHRPDIRTVDFYEKDALGVDQLVSWPIDAAEPIPYEQCKYPLENRAAYFDQRHGVGANILLKRNAKSVNLIGKEHELYRLLQESFRARGVKDFDKVVGADKRLQTFEALKKASLENTQTIHFAMTEEVAQDIAKKINTKNSHPENSPPVPPKELKTPSLMDIVRYAIRNESEKIIDHNVNAFFQKIDNVVESAVRLKILQAPDEASRLGIFNEFENVLISILQDDPAALYGLIDDYAPTEKVLRSIKDKTYARIALSSTFTDDEKKAIKDEIEGIPVPIMAEKMHVYTDGKQVHLKEALGVSVSVSQSQSQEQEQEQEQDQQQQQEQNSKVQSGAEYRDTYSEASWPENIDPRSPNWPAFTPASGVQTASFPVKFINNLARGFSLTRKIPLSIYQFQAALAHAESPLLRKVKSAFDPRLWFSNNFIPQRTDYLCERPIEIGSKSQRELYQVLVQVDTSEEIPKVISMGCLSQLDAKVWREKLAKMKQSGQPGQPGQPKNPLQPSSIKTILYDVPLRTVVAGDDIDLPKLKTSEDFLKLESMVNFLNGNDRCHDDLVPHLSSWIHGYGANAMKEAFRAIHRERKEEVPFEGTMMDRVFRPPVKS